jgi:hypothetical protein
MREQAGKVGRGGRTCVAKGRAGNNEEEWGADEERESSGSRERAEA